jgi:hypothetical protein
MGKVIGEIQVYGTKPALNHLFDYNCRDMLQWKHLLEFKMIEFYVR